MTEIYTHTYITKYIYLIRALIHIQKTLTDLKGEIESNTITIENFNTVLLIIDRSSRQKGNKEIADFNNTIVVG